MRRQGPRRRASRPLRLPSPGPGGRHRIPVGDRGRRRRDLFGDGPLDARKATLQQVLADTGAKRFTYLYDFGDGWSHTVKLDRFEALPAELGNTFMAYAKGPCPPEDCGGPFGYAELLSAYNDPAHEAHHDALDILGPGFSPMADPSRDREAAIHALVARWIRKPRKPR